MASSLKGQKDKPHGQAPRLLPRPTAASAARAAQIATNHNLAVASTNSKQSVSRILTSPSKQTTAQSSVKSNKSPTPNLQPAQDAQKNLSPEESLKQDDKATKLEQIAKTSSHQDNSGKTFEITCDENSEPARVSHVILNRELSPKTESRTPNNSRPVSPVPKSRPQTPKGPSRPNTPQSPRVPSRPVTPCHPNQRPVTPQRTSGLRKPRDGSASNAPRVSTPASIGDQAALAVTVDENDIKAVYAAKQRQFRIMKKELDLKQKTMLELYEGLKSLHQRVVGEGLLAEEVLAQDLVVFNVADWTAEEISDLCRDAASAYCTAGAAEYISSMAPFDESQITELDKEVIQIPTRFADLCLKSFTARQEVIDWVKDLVQSNNPEIGSGEAVNRIAIYNKQGLEFCEALRELKRYSDVAVESLAQLSRRAIHERRALVDVGERLVHEVARLREELKDVKGNSMGHTEELLPDDIRALRQELEEERTGKTQAKEKLATAETQLRQARQRITKMDRQLREADSSIASLTGTVKSLEDQSRQKEVQLEARARKLRESLKTGEMTNNQIAQERNALQDEVQDLKEQIANMLKEHKAAVQELNQTIKELCSSLEDQRTMAQKEREFKIATEEALGNSQILVEELEAKVHHYEIMKPNPDLPSEKEMNLWSELQAVKETLRTTEEEVTACKREKIRFLETLTKIGDTDNNKVGMQQKLAAELVTKEEIISKMQLQLREYTKSLKLNEQKVAQYEQFARDLIAHQKAIETKQGVQTNYPDFQREIMKLRMEVLNASHRNEELAELLAEKEQKMELQEKTSRAQARVIKVREELINMLKNKESEQSRELTCLQQDLDQRMKIVDEVNHQIAAKADEIQALFATLESKQQQIHRLEKIVLALEEQQRRAQAQRTRHEEKIAALEHELAAGPRRERKYLFF